MKIHTIKAKADIRRGRIMEYVVNHNRFYSRICASFVLMLIRRKGLVMLPIAVNIHCSSSPFKGSSLVKKEQRSSSWLLMNRDYFVVKEEEFDIPYNLEDIWNSLGFKSKCYVKITRARKSS